MGDLRFTGLAMQLMPQHSAPPAPHLYCLCVSERALRSALSPPTAFASLGQRAQCSTEDGTLRQADCHMPWGGAT